MSKAETTTKKGLLYSPGLVAVLGFVVVAGGLFGLESLYSKITKAQENLTKAQEYEAERDQLSSIIGTFKQNYQTALSRIKNFEIVLPEGDARFADIITQIEYLAATNGVVLTSIEIGSKEDDTQETDVVSALPAAPVTDASAGADASTTETEKDPGLIAEPNGLTSDIEDRASLNLNITIQTEGDKFLDFVKALENNLRIIDVVSFSMGQDTKDSGSNESADLGQEFVLEAVVYYLPDKTISDQISDTEAMPDGAMPDGAMPEAGASDIP